MAITPLWKAGMEFGNLKEFSNIGNTSVGASTTVAKTGTYSLRMNGAIDPYADTPNVTSQMRIGFHIYPQRNVVSGTRAHYLRVMSGSTSLIGIAINTAGTVLELLIDGAVVASTTAPTFGIWQYFGLDWKRNASGWANFYIDGELILSFTGNTAAAGLAPTIARFGASGTNSATDNYTYFDDLYIDDTTGEAAPLPPPDKRFPLARTNSNTVSNWTPSTGVDNSAMIDEVPVSATDYVSTTASGTIDTYGIAAPSYPTGFTVTAVWPTAMAWKANAAADSSLSFRIADGATVDDGTALHVPSTQGTITERFAVQPDASAWDNADFAALKYGIVSSGTFV